MRSFIALFGLVATVFAVPVPQGSITGPLKQIPAVNGVVQAVGQLAEPVTGGVLPEVLNVLGGVPVVGSTAESTVKGVVATVSRPSCCFTYRQPFLLLSQQASNLKRQSPLSGLGEELQPVAQELGPVLNIVDGVTSEVGGVGPVVCLYLPREIRVNL